MAGGAIRAEQPKVNFRLGVAGDALGRRALELAIGMASRTFSGSVCAFEQEESGVIKIGCVAGAVVATQTVVAKRLNVPGHEAGLSLSVAIGAGLLGERIALAGVTRLASQ